MGGYCRYCNHRCFLLRVLKDGQTVLLATCPSGMNNDLAKTGQTHETAVNPITDPAKAAAIHAAPEPLRPEEFCGYCHHHTDAHTYPKKGEGDEVPCVGCRGGICPTDVCQACKLTLREIDGVWVVMESGTSADGLSYCPPDPDAEEHGLHKPYERARQPR